MLSLREGWHFHFSTRNLFCYKTTQASLFFFFFFHPSQKYFHLEVGKNFRVCGTNKFYSWNSFASNPSCGKERSCEIVMTHQALWFECRDTPDESVRQTISWEYVCCLITNISVPAIKCRDQLTQTKVFLYCGLFFALAKNSPTMHPVYAYWVAEFIRFVITREACRAGTSEGSWLLSVIVTEKNGS